MTLCIAAECEYRDGPAIALIADCRSQTGDVNYPDSMIGADTAYKLKELRGATVMLSGSESDSFDLFAACKRVIQDFVDRKTDYGDLDLDVSQFLGDLRECAAKKKSKLIEHAVLHAIGVPPSEFIKLPTDQHIEIWHKIRGLDLGADLIIACIKHEPILIILDRWGRARWVHNFAVVGSGRQEAQLMLGLHEWQPAELHGARAHLMSVVPLEECLLRLHEAYIVAHMAKPSTVGSAAIHQVLTAKHRSLVLADCLRQIENTVKDKHRIPRAKRNQDKNSLLFRFQDFATGCVQQDEPDEL